VNQYLSLTNYPEINETVSKLHVPPRGK